MNHRPNDPELDRQLGADSLDALDHLFAVAPRDEAFTAREVGALLRLLSERARAGLTNGD